MTQRVHLDATRPGDPLRAALCGQLGVSTETDMSRVTCRSCLMRVAGKRKAAARRERAPTVAELQQELIDGLRATCAPTAAATPAITPALWISSCKGAEHRRCGDCELCVWEREAQLWAAVSPWNKRHTVERPEGAPRWPSLTAALVALVEFDRCDRAAPSALGGILDRIKRGESGGASHDARPDDPLLRRAGELVRVRQALELAYPDGAHQIDAAKCRAILLLRTPGAVTEMPTYEALAELFATTAGDVQALVRNGRRVMAEELAARGLIPTPRPSARAGHRGGPTHYAEATQ